MIPLHETRAAIAVSGIRKYANLAAQTPGCVSLTLGEPDFDTPQAIKDAAIAALQDGMTHYTANQGLPALREAIADYETKRGFPCDASQVLISVGASGAIFNALFAILREGEEVVIPVPAFPLYESHTKIAGGKAVLLDTSKWGFQPVSYTHLTLPTKA